MKKYIQLILLSGLVVFQLGCQKDFLAEDPKGQLTNANFPSNLGQLEEAMHGIYNATAGLSEEAAIIVRSCGTEEMTTFNSENKYWQEYCDNYTMDQNQATAPEARDATVWNNCYAAIKQANWLLEAVNNASGNVDPRVLDLARGQAYFFRAFAYFHLHRFFGRMPMILSIDITKLPATLATFQEIYDQILSDLENADNLLPKFKWDANSLSPEIFNSMPPLWKDPQISKAMPTQGWVRTLRSEVYLTMAGWPLNPPADNPNLTPQDAAAIALYEKAAADAKYVIDNKDAFGYVLEPDFKDLWLFDTQYTENESIIKMHYNRYGRDEGLAPQSGRPRLEPGEPWSGWNDYFIERPYYYSYPSSYRKDITFIPGYFEGAKDPANWRLWNERPKSKVYDFFHPYLAKWRSSFSFPYDSLWADNIIADPLVSERSIALMRYANVLFIYAEATTRATWSVTPDAVEAVNQIRRRAHNNTRNTRWPIESVPIYSPSPKYDLPSGLSVTQFLDSLLMEKSWETLGEPECRWHDLVRLDEVYEVAQKVKAQRDNLVYFSSKGVPDSDLELVDGRWLMPANSNLLHYYIDKIGDIPADRRRLHYLWAPIAEIRNNPSLFSY